MPDEAGAQVHGFRELAAGSRQLAGRIEDAAGREFLGVAEQEASQVRSVVPRHTGHLAGSVDAALTKNRATVGIGAGVPYAGWIEFGGKRTGRAGGIAQRPYISKGRYLYPVALDAEPQLVAAGQKTAKTEIARQRWATPKA